MVASVNEPLGSCPPQSTKPRLWAFPLPLSTCIEDHAVGSASLTCVSILYSVLDYF